jgi:hypothetical protein
VTQRHFVRLPLAEQWRLRAHDSPAEAGQEIAFAEQFFRPQSSNAMGEFTLLAPGFAALRSALAIKPESAGGSVVTRRTAP